MEEKQPLDEKDVKKIMREEKYIEKADARRHSSMHIASFVLGIISILGQLFWFISLPCGVLAIVFGARSVHKTASKLGKAGLILGIIGIAITIFIYSALLFLTFLARL